MEVYIIIGIFILIILLWIIMTYNKLVESRNKIRNQWSQVDVLLKMRFDLIPNIVETVKGYAIHEEQTLLAVIDARNSAINSKTPEDEIKADQELTNKLTKLMALCESYPELKADSNFSKLQESLNDVENKIAYARQFYNDSVLKYKNIIEKFPTLLIARMLGFKQEQFFEITETEKENIKVKF